MYHSETLGFGSGGQGLWTVPSSPPELQITPQEHLQVACALWEVAVISDNDADAPEGTFEHRVAEIASP